MRGVDIIISSIPGKIKIGAVVSVAGAVGAVSVFAGSGSSVSSEYTLIEWDKSFKTKDKADEFIHDKENAYDRIEVPGEEYYYIKSSGEIDALINSGKKDNNELLIKTQEELRENFFIDLSRDSATSGRPLSVSPYNMYGQSYWIPSDYNDDGGNKIWEFNTSENKTSELYAGSTLSKYYLGIDLNDLDKHRAHTSIVSAMNSLVETNGVEYTFNGLVFNTLPEIYTYFSNNYVSIVDKVQSMQESPYVASNGSNLTSRLNYDSINEAISALISNATDYEKTLISNYNWTKDDWEETASYETLRDEWIADNSVAGSGDSWLTWANSTTMVDFMKDRRYFEGMSDHSWYYRYIWNSNFNENSIWRGFRGSMAFGRKLFESEYTEVDPEDIIDPAKVVGNWDNSATYWENDITIHNGYYWKAKWWTNGEEPGPTLSWTNMGIYTGTSSDFQVPTVDPTKAFTCNGNTVANDTQFINDFKDFWTEFNFQEARDFETEVKAKLCEGGLPLYAEKQSNSTNGRGWYEDFWKSTWLSDGLATSFSPESTPSYTPSEDEYRDSIEYVSHFNSWKNTQDSLGIKYWNSSKFNSNADVLNAINARVTTDITAALFKNVTFKKGTYTYPGDSTVYEVENTTEQKVKEIIEAAFYNDKKYTTSPGGLYSLKSGADFVCIGIDPNEAPSDVSYDVMKAFLKDKLMVKYGMPGQTNEIFESITSFNNDVNKKVVVYKDFNNSGRDIMHYVTETEETFNDYIWNDMEGHGFSVVKDVTETVTKIVLSIDKNKKQFDTVEEAIAYWESMIAQ